MTELPKVVEILIISTIIVFGVPIFCMLVLGACAVWNMIGWSM